MRNLLWLAAAGVLLAGTAITGLTLSGYQSPPTPPAINLGGAGAATFHTARAAARQVGGARSRPARCASATGTSAGKPVRPLPFAVPVRIVIPAICVRASVIPLGLNRNGTVRVPSLSQPQLTSWFDDGPAPGEVGPAALYGHVDTAAAGPAVFFRLVNLVPGDKVDITRADHRVAVFAVYRVAEYAKNAFPTMRVYGDTRGAELRLITCGGTFDPRTGSYEDNIVVYARLTAS